MARMTNRPSDAALRKTTFKPNSLTADGSGLYLRTGPTGSKAWTFICIREGKRRDRLRQVSRDDIARGPRQGDGRA